MDHFSADDGERLSVRIHGNGPPLILLHGWTASHAVWNPVLATLRPHHRIFCPDARGHGNHPRLVSQPPDVARLARDVINLMDHFGVEKAAFAGHSMGALTLWQLVRDFGCQRLTHLCLIDQSPKLMTDPTWSLGIYTDFDEQDARQFDDQLQEDFAEAVLGLIASGLNAKAKETYARNSWGWQVMRESLRQLDPAPLIAIWRSLVRADYRDVLATVHVPTLLVWGEQSNFYSLATGDHVRRNMPMATLNTYASADHCPQLYQPERFAEELIGFLANLPADGRMTPPAP